PVPLQSVLSPADQIHDVIRSEEVLHGPRFQLGFCSVIFPVKFPSQANYDRQKLQTRTGSSLFFSPNRAQVRHATQQHHSVEPEPQMATVKLRTGTPTNQSPSA
ncbi:hypothetical protein XENOCAPTIV_014340, partial [Xenoophorus captivus]